MKRSQKLLIVAVCFIASLIGFMIRLPAAFRHSDKELHALFYFIAAAILNILYARTSLFRHLVIFCVLYLFGYFIEHAQAFSNRFFARRIHGRYDPEDIAFNIKGLLLFSCVWALYIGGAYLLKKQKANDRINK